MGQKLFNFTGTFILLHMFATSLCMMTFKHYRLDSSATRIASEGFMSVSGVSKERCFAKCAENLACCHISYEDAQGGCILSSLNDTGSITASGWSFFRLAPPIEITVGGHIITISSQRVTKTEAENLCASSGLGRLVEIRTEQMYAEISGYLTSLPQDIKDLYGDIRIAGVYSSGQYKLPDGSPLPITTANSYDIDGTSACLLVRQTASYQIDDRYCNGPYSFMCERM